MKNIRVLYICHDENEFGGSVLSLINILNGIQDFVTPIILFRDKCKVSSYFEAHSFQCVYSEYNKWAVRPYPDKRSFIRRWASYIKQYLLLRNDAKKVYEDIKDLQIDIVHSNSSTYVVGYFLAKWMNAKHVWHIREILSLFFEMMPIIGWKWMRLLLRKTDQVICITEAVAKHWQIYDYNSVSCKWDAVRKKEDACYLANKESFFLFCSNVIIEKKGAHIAIEAFAKSELWKSGYSLQIVGNIYDNDYKQRLDNLIEQYEITKYVVFLGSTNDVKSFLLKASALLMCSAYEGLGRVTVESMFYGCPVIGHNSGGTSEIITSGENGFLFNNVDECCELIKMVVTNNVEDVIMKAQLFAKNHFSEEEYGKFIMSVYNKIITNHAV